MNEGDFDKKISEKLKDDHKNYPDMDKNWQKVVKKLAENPSSKPIAGGVIVLPNEKEGNQKSSLIPWLLAGLLLLLSSNAWFIWHLYEAKNSQKSVILDNKVVAQTPQTVRLYDTIVETKVIYKVDTIYKTVVVQETFGSQNNNALLSTKLGNNRFVTTIPPSVFSPNSDIKQALSNTSTLTAINSGKTTSTINEKERTTQAETKTNSKTENTITASKIETNTMDKTAQTTDEKIDDKTATSHILQDGTNENKDTIAQNHLQSFGNLAQSHTNTDSLNDNSHTALSKTDSVKIAVVPYDSLELKPQQGLVENIIIKPSRKKLVINHYGIGLQGGTSWELPKLSGVDNGYWMGLTNEIAFNKHLRLSISADYMSFYYKSLTRSTLHAIPDNPPMTENYNLKYIESTTPSILAGLNVSYFLKPNTKINPFVSVQYSHRWVVPHSVEFEFTNKITGDEKSFRVENYSHQDNWLLFGAGVEIPLAKKVFGQLKAEYLYDPNHGNSSLKYVLLRGGIFYRF